MKTKLLKRLRRKFRLQEIDGHYRVYSQSIMKVEYTEWTSLEVAQIQQRRKILAAARGNSLQAAYV